MNGGPKAPFGKVTVSASIIRHVGQRSYVDVCMKTCFFGIGGNFLSRGVGERDIQRTLLMRM